MFEFAARLWLLALPLALMPVVAWFRPHALRFPGVVQAARTAPTAIAQLRTLASVLPALLDGVAIGLTVVALARPQHIEHETIRDSDGLDILLAIDTSGSMKSPDMGRGLSPVTRLDAAKEVMGRFVEARPDDRVGLLVFGQEAFVQVPPTLDSSTLVDFISELDIGMAGPNATAVGDAIAVGVKRLKDLKAPSKLLILVTDGKSNSGTVQPIDAARAAKALGVKIYTIGVGTSRIDDQELQAVAETTGGSYYSAPTESQLAKVYSDIDKNEKTTAKVHEYVHRDELYADWLWPALGTFCLAFGLSSSLLRRLP